MSPLPSPPPPPPPPLPSHSGWSQLYEYTSDLLCLQFCMPPTQHYSPLLSSVNTPLEVSRALSAHPDRAFAKYICDGLCMGFRIGFQYGSPLRSASANMPSARLHPEVIQDYLRKEVAKGRMLGPFPSETNFLPLHVNRFGVIPKGHNTGKWRLITDLSFQSVIDGTDPDLCTLSYLTVDKIAAEAERLGRGSLLVKVDIESVYRLIPVHPQDRLLQAVRWDGKLYIDLMLPFGL